jgi:DNA polymerase elongation subunit (family B)
MKFYTSIKLQGNNILERYIENGRKYSHKRNFSPKLFVSTHKDTQYKTIYGKPCEEISFKSCFDMYAFKKRYANVHGFDIHGDISPINQYISLNYKNAIEYNSSQLETLIYDIETTCENGFPDVMEAVEEITCITLYSTLKKQYYVLTNKKWGSWSSENQSHLNLVHIECKTDYDLCYNVLRIIEKLSPDIITGFNIDVFDTPFLVNRLTRVLGEDMTRRLSPWKNITSKDVTNDYGKEYTEYTLQGIESLDFIKLYKKFYKQTSESFSLNYISSEELGEEKLDHSEFSQMHLFYKQNYQKYVDYNIKDVWLVIKLEEKLKLIELAINMAYMAKSNFSDVFFPTRIWDTIIYNHLAGSNIQIPPRSDVIARSYEGAYVKPAITGLFRWITTLDATSLYPSIMMQCNISPECLKDTIPNVTIESIINHSIDNSKVIENNLSLTANGVCYSNDEQGLFPFLIEKMFKERKAAKTEMLRLEAENYELHKQKISSLDIHQNSLKILLNSLYGAMAAKGFRYYNPLIAESITLTGQAIIKSAEKTINDYLNSLLKTDIDYVILIDTDSCGITLESIVDKVNLNTVERKINFVDKFCKERLQPQLDKTFNELARYLNTTSNRISFKREIIADSGFIHAKKRYVLQVWDKEGVRYKTPKSKIMGMQSSRNSTPQLCRNFLKRIYGEILNTDKNHVKQSMEDFYHEFMKLPLYDIANPCTANNMDKYHREVGIYGLGTPISTKSALIYNYLLKDLQIDTKYRTIDNGDKIRYFYLTQPNPLRENAIGFLDTFPEEFGLHDYIDYERQYDAIVRKPVNDVLKSCKWIFTNIEEETLSDYF